MPTHCYHLRRHIAIICFDGWIPSISTHCYHLPRHIAAVCVNTLPLPASTHCYQPCRQFDTFYVNRLRSSASTHCYRLVDTLPPFASTNYRRVRRHITAVCVDTLPPSASTHCHRLCRLFCIVCVYQLVTCGRLMHHPQANILICVDNWSQCVDGGRLKHGLGGCHTPPHPPLFTALIGSTEELSKTRDEQFKLSGHCLHVLKSLKDRLREEGIETSTVASSIVETIADGNQLPRDVAPLQQNNDPPGNNQLPPRESQSQCLSCSPSRREASNETATRASGIEDHIILSDLLKTPPKPFSGEPGTYQQWASILQHRMSQVRSISSIQKLQVLQIHTSKTPQQICSDALKTITEANAEATLSNVWEAFRRRYGNQYTQVELIKDRIRKFPIIGSQEDPDAFKERVDDLSHLCSHIHSLMATHSFLKRYFDEDLPVLTAKLNERLFGRWRTVKTKSSGARGLKTPLQARVRL